MQLTLFYDKNKSRIRIPCPTPLLRARSAHSSMSASSPPEMQVACQCTCALKVEDLTFVQKKEVKAKSVPQLCNDVDVYCTKQLKSAGDKNDSAIHAAQLCSTLSRVAHECTSANLQRFEEKLSQGRAL